MSPRRLARNRSPGATVCCTLGCGLHNILRRHGRISVDHGGEYWERVPTLIASSAESSITQLPWAPLRQELESLQTIMKAAEGFVRSEPLVPAGWSLTEEGELEEALPRLNEFVKTGQRIYFDLAPSGAPLLHIAPLPPTNTTL